MNRILLRPAEAAEAVGLGRSKLYQLIASGDIPTARIGGCVRIPVDALRAWAEAQVRPSAPPSQPQSAPEAVSAA